MADTGDVITIGGQEFRPLRETYDVLLGREKLEEREGELVDEVNGLAARARHSFARIDELSRAEGDFDTKALDALKRERKKIRGEARTASLELFRLRVETVALRLDPTPEVDFLLANLDEDELEEVVEALNARPTRTGSGPESDES